MARRRKGRRRRKARPSLTGWISLGVLAAPAVEVLTGTGTMKSKFDSMKLRYTGISPSGQFIADLPMKTYGAALVPLIAKKAFTMLGGRMPKGSPFNA